MTVEEQIQKRDQQLSKEEAEALQDNFTELLERYIPFFKWIYRMHQEALKTFGENQLIDFATPPIELQPVNGRIRFYVRKKLSREVLNDDWNMVYREFQEGNSFHYQPGIDKPMIRIPDTIEGYRTEVVEKP